VKSQHIEKGTLLLSATFKSMLGIITQVNESDAGSNRPIKFIENPG
jgi:hypothetical protein